MQLKPNTFLQGGKYRIVRVLGQGGFGITYEAEHMYLGETVAVKEFFMKDVCNRDGDTSIVSVPSVGSQALFSRYKAKFIKEARTIWKLDNPHIVRLLDIFEENGTAYYVMELLPGGSLADKIKKEGLMSEIQAEAFIRQVADALAVVHARNTVHLDVKPSNILLNSAGEAVLIDFGISKHYDRAGEQTSSTPVGMSKGFAPLEQSRDGDVSQFGPSTDIYALGATLYNMVSGQVPPAASVVAEDGLPRPQNLSDHLWNVIHEAMQPFRKDRPKDIAAFLAEFDKVKPSPASVSFESPPDMTGIKDTGFKKPRPLEKVEPGPAPIQNTSPKFKAIFVRLLMAILGVGVLAAVVIFAPKNCSSEQGSSSQEKTGLSYRESTEHEWVDMGLSVKWATCNIGASSPEEYGTYFAWGETTPKAEYDWPNYRFRIDGYSKETISLTKYNIVDGGESCLDLSDDAARVNWRGKWRMPTKAEQDELRDRDNCTWTWESRNGTYGYDVKSKKTGNSIFLPAAGRVIGTDFYNAATYGYYWSSSAASHLYEASCLGFRSNSVKWSDYENRNRGLPVRPVMD